MVISNIGKWLYRVYMYKLLFVNVSVSLIVSGVQPHMTKDRLTSANKGGVMMFVHQQISASPLNINIPGLEFNGAIT